VMLITDPTFAAGRDFAERPRARNSQRLGPNQVLVDYAQNEEKVDEGEWFYTSGDDRIFPARFPGRQVRACITARRSKKFT